MPNSYNYKIIVSLIISFFPIIISQIILSSAYNTLDDVAMQLISSGAISGNPSQYIYSTSTHIGVLLKSLYNYSSCINWYYILLITHYYIFTFSIVLYLVNYKNQYSKKTISLVLIINIYFLIKPSFTIVSILIVFSAFLYLNNYIKKLNKISLTYGIFLLILSVLIRYEALVIFLALYGTILITDGIKLKKYWFLTILLTCIISLLINNYIEKIELNDAYGFRFVEFLEATETIIDNPTNITIEALDQVGWNDNAMVMMKEFFFIDPKVFSLENTNNFAKNVNSNRSLYEILDSLKYSIYLTLPIFIFLITILILNRKSISKNRNTRIILASTLLILYILLLKYRLPARLLAPIIYINILNILISHPYLYKKLWEKLYLTVFCIILIYQTVQISISNESNKKLFIETINYFKENDQYIYQLTSTSIAFEHLAGFKNILNPIPNNLLYFGWLIGHKSYFDNLKKFNIENHAKALFTRKDIRLVCDNEFLVSNLESFAKHYYNIKIKYKIVEKNPTEIYTLE